MGLTGKILLRIIIVYFFIAFIAPLAEASPQRCERLLNSSSPLTDIIKPSLRSFGELTDAMPNMRVRDLVAYVNEQTEEMIADLIEIAPQMQPVVRDNILLRAPTLRKTAAQRARLERAVEEFGDAVIPHGPTPLPAEVYAVWGPRFKLLSGLSPDSGRFGILGELLVASRLPDVTHMNVGPYHLITASAHHHLLKEVTDEDREWMRSMGRANFEIDVIFDGGQSVGEIKFLRSPVIKGTENFQKLENNAVRLSRWLRILRENGLGNREPYFLFLGNPPSEDLLEMLRNHGIESIVLPLDNSSPLEDSTP